MNATGVREGENSSESREIASGELVLGIEGRRGGRAAYPRLERGFLEYSTFSFSPFPLGIAARIVSG